MAGDGIRVLLVEDEESFARLTRDMLANERDEDFLLAWADTLAKALDLLAREPFQACLLDLNLPDSLGLDTVHRLRAAHPELPIVVLTGEKEPGLAQAVLAAGAQGFFQKLEISGKLLAREIHNAIERKTFELKLENQAGKLAERVNERTRQLESAKQQWEQTFDAVPDQILIIDRDHKVVRVNQAVADAWAKPFPEIIGRHCYELFHGTDQPIANCPHKALLEDGKEHHRGLYDKPRDRHYLLSTSPLHDAQGKVWGSVHVARDISPLKKAEARLRESAARTQMILEQLPDPTVLYDLAGRVQYINAAFQETFGWTREELMNQQIPFVPPEAREETIARVREMQAGKPLRGFETVRLNKSGDRLNVLLNTAPLMDEDGASSGNIVLLHDISAMKNDQAARRRSEERFRTLVETMNEGLAIVDESRTLTYANARFCQMLGYSEKEILGKPYFHLLDEENRKVTERAWLDREAGKDVSYEVAYTKKDGSRLHAIVSPKGMFDENGKFLGSFSTVTDITDLKSLQSQLFQAQKLEGIGQMAAGIAHEINTPTQYVTSNTRFLSDAFDDLMELLKAHQELAGELKAQGNKSDHLARLDELAEELDYEFLAEEIPKALGANREGLDRIAKIVLSIKEFAHPGRAEKQAADINKAILNTINVARNEWKYVAEVQTDLAENLPMVPCVIGELNQVILNLIVNAAQAMTDTDSGGGERKGIIKIATRPLEDWAEITVSDNGSGIPDGIRERIFDPFFTTKEPGKGTGQGLAITYRSIVDNHQGTVSVDSEPGRGTTFRIRLPLIVDNEESEA